MTKKVLYINGDSWLAGPKVIRLLDKKYSIFDNYIVINQSIYGDSNYSIINRTIENVNALKALGIVPYVIVGLSEVGRGFEKEIPWLLPDRNKSNDLNKYLRALLEVEIEILNKELADVPRYICSAWTTNITGNKNFIDFVMPDNIDFLETHILFHKWIDWFSKRQKLFNFTKESIIEAIDRSERYQKVLIETGLIDETIHLNDQSEKTVEIYIEFFKHVFLQLNNKTE